MLTIIGALLGFITSFAPALLKYWTQKEDHKHELNVLEVQSKMQAQGHQERLEEINVEADVRESELQQQAAKLVPSGVKIIDGLLYFYNGTVRPTITYAYFTTYALVKYAIYIQIRLNGVSWAPALSSIWTPTDQAMLATVLGFWFGQRQLAKYLKVKN